MSVPRIEWAKNLLNIYRHRPKFWMVNRAKERVQLPDLRNVNETCRDPVVRVCVCACGAPKLQRVTPNKFSFQLTFVLLNKFSFFSRGPAERQVR